jgi:hypothetical protein
MPRLSDIDMVARIKFNGACNIEMYESELYFYPLPPPVVLLLHFYLQSACCGSETRCVAMRKERVKEAEKNI